MQRAQATTPPHILTGIITRILDGDTITLREAATGKRYRLRLASIDAPEKDQPYGKEAALLLKQLALGKYAEAHIKESDKYHRLVAHVYIATPIEPNALLPKQSLAPATSAAQATASLSNKTEPPLQDLCCTLLEQGAAWHLSYFDRTDKYYALHALLQSLAQKQKLGLWARAFPIAPWQWRKRKNAEQNDKLSVFFSIKLIIGK